MLSAVMLNVLNVTNIPFMLSVVMLKVIMPSDVAPICGRILVRLGWLVFS